MTSEISGISAAIASTETSARQRRDALTARRHLTVVPDPQPEPERRVTLCPAWCVVDHSNPDEGADYHYADATTGGTLLLRLDIESDDRVTLEIVTERVDGDFLGLDEVDDLIAALTAKRAEMAETIAQRTALSPAGGAA